MERKDLSATASSGAATRSKSGDADHQAKNLSRFGFDGERRSQWKRTILLVGLLLALLTMAFELENFGHAKVGRAQAVALDEGAQLGSAYPEITHWPEAVVDEGAQLGSAYPEIRFWPEPVMKAGPRLHLSPGE